MEEGVSLGALRARGGLHPAANQVDMRMTINGEERVVDDGATIATLLAGLDLRRDGIAVAVNDDVVPRTDHAARRLRDGDRVEIIVAVAGG
jgi:thiamine biosynthesis protein ThiS